MIAVARSMPALAARSATRAVLAVALSTVLAAGCALAPTRDGGLGRPLPPPAPPDSGEAAGDDSTIAPALAAARPALEGRLREAHGRLGHGRPPATGVALGELGPGGAQAFVAQLRGGWCYVAIAVAATEGQELDLLLLDAEGLEVSRDASPGSQAGIEVCPVADAAYRLVVRMYGGSSAYALQVYGS